METWEDGNDILKETFNKTEKIRKEISEIMKKDPMSKDDYKKIKALLEDEAVIRNTALEKVEKIHRDNTENVDQQIDES